MSIIKKIYANPKYELTLTQTQLDKLSTLLISVADADLDLLYDSMCANVEDEYELRVDVDACDQYSGCEVEADVLILEEV